MILVPMETPAVRLRLLSLLVLAVTVRGQRMPIPVQRPLCTSQYALANYACSHLPITPNQPLPPPSAPPTPVEPPPSPQAPPSPDHDHEGHHHHHHHHGHHRHRGHRESLAEMECCKWLKQMDNECICDLLVHLPPLLARPPHNYSVFVDDSCIVTFTCGSRFLR